MFHKYVFHKPKYIYFIYKYIKRYESYRYEMHCTKLYVAIN